MGAEDAAVGFDEADVLNMVAEFLQRKKFTKAVEAMKFEMAVRPKNASDPSSEAPTALEEMLLVAGGSAGATRVKELLEHLAASLSVVVPQSDVADSTDETAKPETASAFAQATSCRGDACSIRAIGTQSGDILQDMHVAFEPSSDKVDGLGCKIGTTLLSPPPPAKQKSADIEVDAAATTDEQPAGSAQKEKDAEAAVLAEDDAEPYLPADDVLEPAEPPLPSNLPADTPPEKEKRDAGAVEDEDIDEYSDDDDVGFTRIYIDPEEFFASAGAGFNFSREEFLHNHQELMLQCELAEEEAYDIKNPKYETELERADLNKMFEHYKNASQSNKASGTTKHIPTDEELLARLDPSSTPLSAPPVEPVAAAAVEPVAAAEPAVAAEPAADVVPPVAVEDGSEKHPDADTEASADEVVMAAAAAAAGQVASVEPYDAYDLKSMMLRYMEAGQYDAFDLRVIFERNRTGFEETKDYPIEINGIIAGQYQIVEYLGSAAFSKAVQCVDLRDGSHVCIKIIKNNKDFFDQSLDEIKLLKYLNAHDRDDSHYIVQLYEFFYHKEHLFIVCELLRDNLYEFSKFNRESGSPNYFNLPRLQKITKQCLHALTFIHSLYLIHCDLKPENILIKSYSRCEIKIIDFGSSCFITDHLSSYVQSRSYRAPEVILGMPYDQKIDIWSLGCILAELFTGNVLFQNDSVQTLLSRIVGILGPFDPIYLERGRYMHKFFTKDYTIYEKRPEGDGFAYVIPKRTSLKRRLGTDDKNFIDFVGWLLKVKPEERPTAAEAMSHPWLTESVYEWPE